MKKLGRFEIPIYKHLVVLYFGLPDDVKPNTSACCVLEKDKQAVGIYVSDKSTWPDVVHEIVHAADFILANIGAEMGCATGDSEVRAYLVGFITEKIEKIQKNIKRDE